MNALTQRLQSKMMQAMKVTSLPVRTKSRYDYIQMTATSDNFNKGNIIRLANFLIKSGECKTKTESFSEAWRLAKEKKASFVKVSISDYQFWTKGN